MCRYKTSQRWIKRVEDIKCEADNNSASVAGRMKSGLDDYVRCVRVLIQ
ncbi:hypothetical protein EPYR_00831 [Erwinia pyrifoliae DSM 12163]|nr:hypothetical protein EPYR_00831 [Erwinia pyrifoliae DSM 12163]